VNALPYRAQTLFAINGAQNQALFQEFGLLPSLFFFSTCSARQRNIPAARAAVVHPQFLSTPFWLRKAYRNTEHRRNPSAGRGGKSAAACVLWR